EGLDQRPRESSLRVRIRLWVPHERKDREPGGDEWKLSAPVEDRRDEETVECSAECAPQRDDQEELGTPARSRPVHGEEAVACQAGGEDQDEAEHYVGGQKVLKVEDPRNHGRGDRHGRDDRDHPALCLQAEGNDERRDVEREWHHPYQRDGG